MKSQNQIFGIRTVIEAIRSNKEIDKVFIQKGLQGQLFKELSYLIKDKGISATYVPVEKLNRLTSKNHQGVVAQISPIKFHHFESLIEDLLQTNKLPLLLILDQISDVRNFGAIIRTAECTGVDAIVVQKKGGAPITADTVKTSAGALFNIPICKVDHIKDAIFYLQSASIQIIAKNLNYQFMIST